ncbi:hypothetical protein NPIL_350841 [Nephila pilipes]|uniref:Uncharacterized protein n=1 Tax=Nephila pilipes TaxID=299642 RepID=A0A8X6NU43_NEPPI|nr:hypothetical protein NPIL_350841 [Nephila pilipes]
MHNQSSSISSNQNEAIFKTTINRTKTLKKKGNSKPNSGTYLSPPNYSHMYLESSRERCDRKSTRANQSQAFFPQSINQTETRAQSSAENAEIPRTNLPNGISSPVQLGRKSPIYNMATVASFHDL